MSPDKRTTNILTIDVEDWYMNLDISTWDSYEDRVVLPTEKILKILDEINTQATFFVVGYVAEHFPELIEEIKNKGHEIGMHGYRHTSIKKQTPLEFEENLLKSVRILEDITKEKIKGHRACEFSIVEKTSWAIDILKKSVMDLLPKEMVERKKQPFGVPYSYWVKNEMFELAEQKIEERVLINRIFDGDKCKRLMEGIKKIEDSQLKIGSWNHPYQLSLAWNLFALELWYGVVFS